MIGGKRVGLLGAQTQYKASTWEWLISAYDNDRTRDMNCQCEGEGGLLVCLKDVSSKIAQSNHRRDGAGIEHMRFSFRLPALGLQFSRRWFFLEPITHLVNFKAQYSYHVRHTPSLSITPHDRVHTIEHTTTILFDRRGGLYASCPYCSPILYRPFPAMHSPSISTGPSLSAPKSWLP